MDRRISNTHSPKRNVVNEKRTGVQRLHIDLTVYQNWKGSLELKRMNFTNRYQNRKHVESTLSDILFKVFPHIQDNITKVMSGQERHCHIVSDDKLDAVWSVIDGLYVNNRIDKEIEIYQMGVANSTRIFGALRNTGEQYEFYPLFIDCNHLIYPSIKHNMKDFKSFKTKIR